jgi:hypothetical protein
MFDDPHRTAALDGSLQALSEVATGFERCRHRHARPRLLDRRAHETAGDPVHPANRRDDQPAAMYVTVDGKKTVPFLRCEETGPKYIEYL